MDEVLEQFESALGVNSEDEPKSNFDGLYKNWGKLGNQEERRKEILEIQKSNRQNKLDTFRGILELIDVVEHNEIFQTNGKAYYRPNIYVAGFHKASANYNNVLMMSEWIIEKPADFHKNWYVVPCPKGVRMLVVANQANTKCYSKYGHFCFEFFSALPGGHKPRRSNQCCVLDCFYNENLNTMYIVDLLAWNCQPMTDGETEFRHYWLESQLDLPALSVISKRNEIIFKLLPKTPCSQESFAKFMMSFPPFANDIPALDGLLFYHKRAHYTSGQTPLVGWLYPFMVPEVLGSDIEINGAYAEQKPTDYTNQKDFIEKFEAKFGNKKKGKRSRVNSNVMDTASEPTSVRKTEANPGNTELSAARDMEAFQSNPENTELSAAGDMEAFQSIPENTELSAAGDMEAFQSIPENTELSAAGDMEAFQANPENTELSAAGDMEAFPSNPENTELSAAGDMEAEETQQDETKNASASGDIKVENTEQEIKDSKSSDKEEETTG